MPKKKVLAATGNPTLTGIHALLSGQAACHQDLGPDYYEQRMHVRQAGPQQRQEAWNASVTRSPSRHSAPTPASYWPQPTNPPAAVTPRAACPAEVYFRTIQGRERRIGRLGRRLKQAPAWSAGSSTR